MKKYVRIQSGMSPCIRGIVERWLLDRSQAYSFKSYGIDQSPVLIFENNQDFQSFYSNLLDDVKVGKILTSTEWLMKNAPEMLLPLPDAKDREKQFYEVCLFLEEEQIHPNDKKMIAEGYLRPHSKSRGYADPTMIKEMSKNMVSK